MHEVDGRPARMPLSVWGAILFFAFFTVWFALPVLMGRGDILGLGFSAALAGIHLAGTIGLFWRASWARVYCITILGLWMALLVLNPIVAETKRSLGPLTAMWLLAGWLAGSLLTNRTVHGYFRS